MTTPHGWYVVRFPRSEAAIAGKAMSLQNEYAAIFLSSGGPRDALVLTSSALDFENENWDYYFSPGAMRIAGDLVIARGGTPCDRPDRDRVNLAVGDVNSLARLLREEDGN